jgi:beta-xylosidase
MDRNKEVNEGYAVWIDYNQNGSFSDGELVYSKAASQTTPRIYSLHLLQASTQMRVSMKYNAVPTE